MEVQSNQGHQFFQGANNFTIGRQYNIGQVVNHQSRDLLEVLNPIPDASYCRNRRTSPPDSNCLPGTRRQVLESITNWADGSTLSRNSHIMWLYGYVGCGKSAIAQALAESYAQKGRLAASFFFFRGSGDRSRISRLASTIASQVAAAIPSTAFYIEAAIKAHPGLLEPTYSLTSQLRHLLLQPIQSALGTIGRLAMNLFKPPFLIIIDGLDECEDAQEVAELIDCLVQYFEANPRAPLRIFIASRVEEHIRTRLQTPHVKLVNLVDHTSLDDIRAAMKAGFAAAARHSRVIQAYGREWPGDEAVEQLVVHTGGSFIFMATVLKFILEPADDGRTPMERLPLALGIDPGLDGLYAQTLARAEHLPQFHKIISTIALLLRPLSISALAVLLEVQTFEVVRVLVNLHAIFQVPGDDETPVTFCHNSLREFLNSPERSLNRFALVSDLERLAQRCFELLFMLRTKQNPLSEAALPITQARQDVNNYGLAFWEDHWIGLHRARRLGDEDSKLAFVTWLLSHLSTRYPTPSLLVCAMYILVRTSPIASEARACRRVYGIGSDGRQMKGDELLALLLQPVPLEESRLFLRLFNVLNISRTDLRDSWIALGPQMPSLATYQETIVCVSLRHFIQYIPERGVVAFLPSSKDRAAQILFCRAFLAWPEHALLAIKHFKSQGRPVNELLSWRFIPPQKGDALPEGRLGESQHGVEDGVVTVSSLRETLRKLLRHMQFEAAEKRILVSVLKDIRYALQEEVTDRSHEDLEQAWDWRRSPQDAHGITEFFLGKEGSFVTILDAMSGYVGLLSCLQNTCRHVNETECWRCPMVNLGDELAETGAQPQA